MTFVRRRERGFTLLELMVVVVILAALAIIVLPKFFRDSMKKQYDSEVTAIFSEFTVKEEQYKLEKGAYFATAICPATPVANNSAGVDVNATCITAGSDWYKLNMAPGQATARCTYQVFAGGAGNVATPPAGFTFNQGVGGWWYALATCDIDGKGGTNTQYLTGSSNAVGAGGHGYQTINYGQ
jgi:prepilin-type N-terminal cleavage/methylation domain-containing protein